MKDVIRSVGLLLAMFGANYLGVALLALGQNRHWHALIGERDLTTRVKRRLRTAAVAFLSSSLLLALIRDGAGFGTLLGVNGLSVSALAVVCSISVPGASVASPWLTAIFRKVSSRLTL